MALVQQKETLKYKALAEDLRRQIENGDLKPGERLPSFSEMRAQHGVAPTTVERIYSLLEQEGLVLREQRRGVFVAPPPVRRSTGIVGVHGVSFHKQHPFDAQLVGGIQSVAAQAGLEVLLLNDVSNIKWEKVDGVLDCNTGENLDRVARAKRRRPDLPPGMPYVAALAPMADAVNVVTDDDIAMQNLTQHLLSLGHRRIAYLTALIDPISPRRLAGYREALWNAGIEPQAPWVRQVRTNRRYGYRESGYRCVQRWLRRGWHQLGCTALLTQNDDTAIGAIQAFRDAGLRVPEDVSVAGYDGTEIGDLVSPRLTTVEVPLGEIGAQAMELLIAQIQDAPIRLSTTVLAARLRVRESTAPPGGMQGS